MQRYTVRLNGYALPYAFPLEVKVVTVFDKERVTMLYYEGNKKSIANPFGVNYDPNKTTISKVTMYLRHDRWAITWPIPAEGLTCEENSLYACAIELNGVRLSGLQMAFHKGKVISLDVTQYCDLRPNQVNYVQLAVWKTGIALVTVESWWSVWVEYEFTGEEPSVITPPPSLEDYVKWAFIIGGVAVFGFLGVKALEAWRR